MTVDTTIRKKIYLGNANQTEFAIPFVYIKDSDIRAVRTRADGTAVQILDNCSISHPSGGWAVFNYPLVGTPLEFGESLTIYRVTDTRQLTDLLNGGDFNADVIELALDQITMMVQDLAEEMGRVPVIPISESADFDEMIQNLLIAEAQIAADRRFIEEAAGRFESATETQRGVAYAATADEAENYVSEERDPAGPAFLTPETGKILVDKVTAGLGFDPAAIDRPGTVRIARQSEVESGVTETGRDPAAIRPGEHAASHKITQHLFLASGTWVPDADGYVCSLVLVGGGQAGGNSSGSSSGTSTTRSGGAGGSSGRVWTPPNPVKVGRGVSYQIVVGAGGASNGAAGGNSSFKGATVDTSTTFIPGGTGGYAHKSLAGDVTTYTARAATVAADVVYPAFKRGAKGASGATVSNTSNTYAGGGGGAPGIYLPGTGGTTSFTTAANGAGSYAGTAGTGFGAGGGGAGSSNNTAYAGGRGAQGGVFFTFVRHPGGIE